MAKKAQHRQTKKYYELQSHYQETLKQLKTQQAIILAPVFLATQLEIKQRPILMIMLNLFIFILSFGLTIPYYNQDMILPIWLRILFSFILTSLLNILILFIIIKYQKEEYMQKEETGIQQIKEIYQKLNQQYDKMKKEQLQNIDFSLDPKPKESKKRIQLFRKGGG